MIEDPKAKKETLAYYSAVADDGRVRDLKRAVGQPKSRTQFSSRHTGSDLENLIHYKFAGKYRDQGVSDKPNHLDLSSSVLEDRRERKQYGLRSTDVTRGVISAGRGKRR